MFIGQAGKAMLRVVSWDRIVLLVSIPFVVFLLFYNLEYNPRPWHDEGALLSVSRTLVEDGVYAGRSSDGYQTFGAVQSVGPTVLLPIALSFKLFGIGLVQGRVVVATYALLALALLYVVGQELFGRRIALVGVFLLLGSPAVAYLLLGRQVVGDAPALAFFLGGWLAWSRGIQTGRHQHYLIAGLLLGAAMVTKSQYILMGFGTLAILGLLDLVFYRQKKIGAFLIVGVVAGVCLVAWWGWQLAYYGTDTFRENAAKLSSLAAGTTGFDPHSTLESLKFLTGSQSGHFYYFWGFLALAYTGLLSTRRDPRGLTLGFLVVFTSLWLAYYLFWISPWPQVVYTPAAIASLFVAKLWSDLADGFTVSWDGLWSEIRQGRPAKAHFTPGAMAILGTFMALLTVAAGTGYHLQRVVRYGVLDREGREALAARSPEQLQNPHQVALFLNENVPIGAITETWERELVVLTDHKYHFPDQSLLAPAYAALYRGGPADYALGKDYFEKYRPAYLVVGWYARSTGIYDFEYLESRVTLMTTIGGSEWRYDVYSLHLP